MMSCRRARAARGCAVHGPRLLQQLPDLQTGQLKVSALYVRAHDARPAAMLSQRGCMLDGALAAGFA
jgi:hypothetical protein